MVVTEVILICDDTGIRYLVDVRMRERELSLLRYLFNQTNNCVLGKLLMKVTCCFATFRIGLTRPLTHYDCLVLATQCLRWAYDFLHRW